MSEGGKVAVLRLDASGGHHKLGKQALKIYSASHWAEGLRQQETTALFKKDTVHEFEWFIFFLFY